MTDNLPSLLDAQRRFSEMRAEQIRAEHRHAMRMTWFKLGTDFMAAGDTFAMACALNPNPGVMDIGLQHRARMYELTEKAFSEGCP